MRKPDTWVRNMPEYGPWCDMKRRCHDPKRRNFKDYGGRGIMVCDKWRKSFRDFLTDMGSRPSLKHSIDRIDNDGNYEPGNCRWATREEQGLNTSRNLVITAFGRTGPLGSFVAAHGGNDLAYKRAWERIVKRGWDAERALTAPLDNRGARAR